MITPKIDIYIPESEDPSLFIVHDISTWGHLQGELAHIEITLPGDFEAKKHIFNKKQITVFNSNTLGANCVGCPSDLPLDDGIYIVTVSVGNCIPPKTKKHLRTTQLRRKIDSLLLRLGESCEDEDGLKVKIISSEVLLRIAEAYIRNDDSKNANYFYNQALEKVENLLRCYGSNCI